MPSLFSRCLLVVSLVFFIMGCTQLNHVRQAQQHFNDGAALETKQSFGLPSTLTNGEQPDQMASQYLTQPSPGLYYQMALTDIQRALEKPDDLEKDQLLGHALALKALCEWKLGAFEQSRSTATLAKRQLDRQNLPLNRDKAIMVALEGLIDTEQAYLNILELREQVASWTSSPVSTQQALEIYGTLEKHYQEQVGSLNASGKLRHALRRIEDARSLINPDHPLQIYLTQAQLAALKNWLDELDLFYSVLQQFQPGENSKWSLWFDQEIQTYNRQKTLVLKRLEAQLAEGSQNFLYQWWDVRLFAGSE